MPRLPTVGSDDGTWGSILNTYLEVEHASDGTHSSGGSIAAFILAGAPGGVRLVIKFSKLGQNLDHMN